MTWEIEGGITDLEKCSTSEWWRTPLIQHSGGRGRQISVSSRPAWSTELVPGQAPKLQRNPVAEKKKPT